MKKPKWAKKLTVKEIKHIADTSNTGRASLRVIKINANNPHCTECRYIANKLKNNGVKL
jgi:hypothetical protein